MPRSWPLIVALVILAIDICCLGLWTSWNILDLEDTSIRIGRKRWYWPDEELMAFIIFVSALLPVLLTKIPNHFQSERSNTSLSALMARITFWYAPPFYIVSFLTSLALFFIIMVATDDLRRREFSILGTFFVLICTFSVASWLVRHVVDWGEEKYHIIKSEKIELIDIFLFPFSFACYKVKTQMEKMRNKNDT